MKTCSKCGETKPLTEFRFRKARNCYHPICRSCFNTYLKNRPTRLEDKKRYYFNNRDNIRQKKSIKYQQDKDKIDRRNRTWKRDNRDRMKELRLSRMTNPAQRLRHSISNHIRLAIVSGKGGRSWETLVGYTLADLMSHLQSLWEPGMNWNNYGFPKNGKRTWSIDHRRPVSSYRIESVNDPTFRECWSLANLQPLWFSENSSKRNRWDEHT